MNLGPECHNRKKATYVMMRRRSRQLRSPARALWTIPALIAAFRINWHPAASQAAGTVKMTSADSVKALRVSVNLASIQNACRPRTARNRPTDCNVGSQVR